jgi:ABC-type transporter Mla subunit MlaD
MGPLLVSEHGIGPSPASAQDVVVTEGKIARLRSALRLTGEQLQHWRPVEAALRAAVREQRQAEGLVQKVRERVNTYAGSAMALQRALSAAGPLIASLDDRQRESGRNALRAMGGAAVF